VNKSSIQAIKPPVAISGRFSFLVIIHNRSSRLWESAGANLSEISYHWLDEDWSMVVFDGKRTPLPLGGIAPGGSAEIEVIVEPPPNPGLYRLHITLSKKVSAGLIPKINFPRKSWKSMFPIKVFAQVAP
jgi:hypothetical protein